MIIITGSAAIRPEHRSEALVLGVEHSARSRAEPGCIAHNCHVDAEDPNRIVFVEEWADTAAVKGTSLCQNRERLCGDWERWRWANPIFSCSRQLNCPHVWANLRVNACHALQLRLLTITTHWCIPNPWRR